MTRKTSIILPSFSFFFRVFHLSTAFINLFVYIQSAQGSHCFPQKLVFFRVIKQLFMFVAYDPLAKGSPLFYHQDIPLRSYPSNSLHKHLRPIYKWPGVPCYSPKLLGPYSGPQNNYSCMLLIFPVVIVFITIPMIWIYRRSIFYMPEFSCCLPNTRHGFP